ncbi:MAG: triose-phosphate isomerase [Candidatus Firestonebacteria bacterium]|nr:triose-phosphate isomerase [Candidatus Firestonebacteria bacterium]
MRIPIIAGNWKMFKKQSEAKELVQQIFNSLKEIKGVKIIVIPPFTSLNIVQSIIKNSSIKLGAQNMHWKNEGAYTGEISPVMLREAGCEFVIIGHSERRQYFNETDETVNKKIKSALESGLKPIFCIGEHLSQREEGKHEEIVKKQIEEGLAGINNDQIKNITIAYEPVWAIGTGKTATPEIANAMHKFIRNKIAGLFISDIAENIIILYGGSVKPENTSSLMNEKDIDGALVGGASLDGESFTNIIKSCAIAFKFYQ